MQLFHSCIAELLQAVGMVYSWHIIDAFLACACGHSAYGHSGHTAICSFQGKALSAFAAGCQAGAGSNLGVDVNMYPCCGSFDRHLQANVICCTALPCALASHYFRKHGEGWCWRGLNLHGLVPCEGFVRVCPAVPWSGWTAVLIPGVYLLHYRKSVLQG